MAGPDRSNTPAVVVLVAVVGLLATIGASALGGYWANRSVERQFESERSAAIQDQRREVYIDYLTATTRLCDAWDQVDDGEVSSSDKNALHDALIEILNQQARVLLIAGPGADEAVDTFTEHLTDETAEREEEGQLSITVPSACERYRYYRDAFVEGAEPDLD